MARKTIDVEYMKAWANTMLIGDDPQLKIFRLGISLMLEEILMKSGKYKGFRFLDQENDSSRRQYF